MNQKLYLGTYTRNESEGIYTMNLDTEKKTLNDLCLLAEIKNPSYLSLSKERSFFVTIGDDGDGKGGIATYHLDENGEAKQLDTAFESNPNPAYVSYDQANGLAYSANYDGGFISLYTVGDNGELDLVDRVDQPGSGPHPNQEASHAHYIKRSPDGKFVHVCNLGTDYVYTYKVTDDNKFEEVNKVQLKPGSGPRHLAFHPSLPIVYVLAELSCEMQVFNYDEATGSLEHFQTVDTVQEFDDSYSAAAVRLSNDGKFLYASTRGINIITTYEIDQEDGSLTAIDWTDTHGETPRDFNLDKSNQFVVCGHQDTNVMTLFERDEKSGKLSVLETKIFAPEVINVEFD